MVSTKIHPYAEFLAEREELMRHKWLLSEAAQHDVGFEFALLDWAKNHRAIWREKRRASSVIKKGAPPKAEAP